MAEQVSIPRLGLTVSKESVESAIIKSIRELGCDQPRKPQLDVVLNFIRGRDTFVSLPTGSGKSVCFACTPLAFDKLRASPIHHCITVVVSPLTALMEDQVSKFRAKGLKAAYVGCAEVDSDGILDGDVQLVYLSPESVLSHTHWREMFLTPNYQNNLVCLAVDEAHLVEKWGKDFRTDFAHISEIRSLLPKNTNVMALTATANINTRKVIIHSLEMQSCYLLTKNPNQLNIKYSVFIKPSNPLMIIQPFLDNLKAGLRMRGKCLIFCRSYDDTNMMYELIALDLAKHDALFLPNDHPNCTCEKFDASTSLSVRKRIIESFTKRDGGVQMVVSTIAFGMGIDVPNIYSVIHWGPPGDLESYVQETGRGGRDGCATTATLYYAKGDLLRTDEAMRNYCVNKSLQCRRIMLMAPFCGFVEKPKILHMCCDVCAKQCNCISCMAVNESVRLSEPSEEDLVTFQNFSEDENDELCYNKRKELYTKLQQLQSDLLSTEPASALVGPEILCGLTNATIRAIVKKCLLLKSPEDVLSLGISSLVYAKLIYNIINTFQS